MGIVNFEIDVCALSDVGMVRTHNEDYNKIAKTRNGDLFVVCDGMGGHAGGATASRIGVESICRYIETNECTIPQQLLTGALEYANSQIYNESRANPQLKGMGTTACIVLVRDGKAWYAHVGDSRIYYYNASHQGLYRLTKDHSVVQSMIDQGMISEEEAQHHPDKNKIRKSLGIKDTVEPEPCQMPLTPADGDMIMICSDGLSGMISEDDILEVLSTTSDINEAGKILIELANSEGGTDNITVQIVRFSDTNCRDAVFSPKNKGIRRILTDSRPSKRNRRPWVILGIVSLIVMAGLLFMLPSRQESSTDSPSCPAEVAKQEYAYEKLIRSKVPWATFTKYNTTWHIYDHAVEKGKHVMVNMSDFSYRIGRYTKRTGENDYIPVLDCKEQHFRSNGEPK